jgi:hypothetical protein
MNRETPPLRPSARVRLEVALLDDDQAAPAPAASPGLDGRTRLTVLVVSAEADFRRYVRECLRERTDLRLLEAATVTAAVDRAALESPELLIVDGPESDVLAILATSRALVVVDDLPREGPASGARVRRILRPFSAEALAVEVDLLLG